MKRAVAPVLILFLLVGFFIFVIAESDDGDGNSPASPSMNADDGDDDDGGVETSSDDGSDDDDDDESGIEDESDDDSDDNLISSLDEDEEKGEKERTREEKMITLRDEDGNEYNVTVRIETRNNGEETQIKVKVRGVEIESDVEIEQESDGSLKAKLSNGKKADIKILPDTASEMASEKLRLRGFNVELKEVGEGNNLSVVYEGEGERDVKFIGLFKVRARITARIDPETGQAVEIDKPWWYFLTTETEEDVLCTLETKLCDDGSSVSRNPDLNCEFDPCPVIENSS